MESGEGGRGREEMKIIRENTGTVIRGRNRERDKVGRKGGKKWAAMRTGRQIEGQNNNRGKNKMLALAAWCTTFHSVSVGFCGCGRMSSDFRPEIKKRERRETE